MEIGEFNNNKVKPETAVALLKKNGILATIDEAKTILEFIYFLTELSIDQHFTDDKNLDKPL